MSGVLHAEPIRVEYSAPASCPSEEEFLGGVLARTARAQRAEAQGAATTFVVRLTTEGTGHLVVRTANGAETERDVDGDTCAEVASALALIAALTIDPDASPTPVLPPPPPPVALATPVTTREQASPIVVRPRARWHVGASADASVTAGLSPSAIFGVPIALHAVGPVSFHLAFERASSGSVDVTGGAATFTWTVGVLEGCPHRWTWGSISLEPCLRVEGGVLQSRGDRIVPAREDTRGWFALGAVGRAEWLFAGPMFLEIDAGIHTPFMRTTYYFEPNTTIYRAPAVSPLAAAGVGARFL